MVFAGWLGLKTKGEILLLLYLPIVVMGFKAGYDRCPPRTTRKNLTGWADTAIIDCTASINKRLELSTLGLEQVG